MSDNVRIELNGLPAVMKRLGDVVERKMTKSILMVHANVVRSLQQGSPPPSRPGEPPHSKTGALLNSVHWHVVRSGTRIVGMVMAEKSYSRFLEYGSSRMRARPFMRPALARAWPHIKEIFGGPIVRVTNSQERPAVKLAEMPGEAAAGPVATPVPGGLVQQ